MSNDTEELVVRGGDGDLEAIEELFALHRNRLEHMIHLRLDPRLRARLDDADVLQDVYMEACRRFDHYLANKNVPFFVWLRFLTGCSPSIAGTAPA